MGFLGGCHLLGRSANHELATLVAGLRTDIDDPVGGLDDIQIMLDDNDAVSFRDKALEGFQQDRDVVDMQAGGRLVKNEKSPTGFMTRKARGKLQALGFAPTQDIEGLSELQVVEADVGEELQRCTDGLGFGSTLEEGDRLPSCHLQYVVDRLAAVTDRQHALLIALSLTLRAAEEEIAQELHFDFLESQARAPVTASLSRVEGECGGAHPRLDRLILHAEEFTDRIEDPEIDGRGGAWGTGQG